MPDRWVNRWYVEGTTGTRYTVAIDRNGEFGCSCPAWKFKRMHCRHILQIKLKLANENIETLKSAVADPRQIRRETAAEELLFSIGGRMKRVLDMD